MWNLMSGFLNNDVGDGGFYPPFDDHHQGGGSQFQTFYECFSCTYAAREDINLGNKILLPPSALSTLARLDVAWPMLFALTNTQHNKETHCGVLEFSADESKCYLPTWLMENLQLKEGALVRVTNVALPKGTFVKLQPLTSNFLDLTNHRAVLENSLRNYGCLTTGDVVAIHHDENVYRIEILETRPERAISVIETDIEVDFAPPKDYVEPVGVPTEARTNSRDGCRDGKNAIESIGRTLDGLACEYASRMDSLKLDPEPWLNVIKHGVRVHNPAYKAKTSKRPMFQGSGNRLG